MDIVTDVYSVEDNVESEGDIIDVNSVATQETIIPDPTAGFSDRELLVAIYKQQAQIGISLNWLTENLAGVFNMVNAVSQNGGGVRGMMKMMKELNNNG